ncbi:MAG: hypothetical protein IPJ65_16615 [Archangiaceae bacterium]|nr:hypothetical protein [Archangiaceae bacterium]
MHEAAARAIERLGDLDLIKYEDVPIDGSADLSLWEEVAPHLSATLTEVNALVNEIRTHFPFGELYTDRKQAYVDEAIQGGATKLQGQVAELGQRVRDPSVVADRWALISELQVFRVGFRETIGSMVFDSASVLEEVKRQEVEPGYEDALKTALSVRSTSTDLRRLMRARLSKVAECEPEDVEWNAQQLEKELDSFGRTPAWRAIRAQDKKQILEFRNHLREINRPGVKKTELAVLIEPFVEFVDSFEAVNQREILMVHDREVSAQIGVQLESVSTQASYDSSAAMGAFGEALSSAVALYGRSPELDSFIRKTRKAPPGPEEVSVTAEIFTQLLANLSLY